MSEFAAPPLSTRDSDRPRGEDSWTESHLGVDLFYTSIFVDSDVPALGPDSQERDPFESQGASCYRGYLAEYPDGPVFEQTAKEGYFYRGPEGMDFSEVTLSRGGEWEYDFSYTTPDRQEHLNVPCQDVVTILGLTWDRQRGWLDSSGGLVAFESRAKRRSGLFIRRDALNTYLATTKRKLVYRRFANRGLFANSGSDSSQIDIFTWLSYQPSKGLRVLNEIRRPFNC